MNTVRVFLVLLVATSAIHGDEITVRPLPAPDFKSSPAAAATSPVKLRLVSNAANEITDDDAWFERNSLVLNQETELPDSLPETVEGLRFLKAIRSGDRLLGIYGADYSGGSIVVGLDSHGDVDYAYDFSEYRLAPRNVKSDLAGVNQRIRWAEQRGQVLYVSHGHNTYAKSSHGMNAYVSAIDTRSGKALWHSAPLVSNSSNFIFLSDRYLLTGYGFTAEPDFLHVLRISDGKAVGRIPLKSGPSYILESGERIHVRTYNRDYVFAIEGKR